MAAKRDYYEVLGISRDADDQAVKKAYRRLALKYHPDKNPGNKESEESFKEASEAYEILSNPEKRRRYDQFGHEGVSSAFSRGGFSWNDFTHFGDFEDIFGDFFSSFFGGGGRSRRGQPNRGRDIRIHYKINLEESFEGKEEELMFKRLEPCEKCDGSGLAEGASKRTCPRCHGKGQVRIMQSFFQLTTTCDMCRGEGEIIDNPCTECNGEGRILKKVKVKVTIPRGVDNHMELVIRGEGEIGPRGGPRGNLLVAILVEEHPFFKRRGDDIFCRIPITFTQAALGASIEVPTLHGPKKLKIPPGTQTHQVLVLKRMGMPRNEAAFGDQHVQVIIKVPKKLDSRQKELLKEYAELERTPSIGQKGFFDKFRESINEVKDIFH